MEPLQCARRTGKLRERPGFTLVELLVVVLILAILMAVALPLYLAALRDSERKTARSNLQMLVNAEQAHRTRVLAHTYTSSLSDLVGPDKELHVPPVGPGQTLYTLYTGGQQLADGRTVPDGAVGACAKDASQGTFGDYGCLIPGADFQ